ncbi:MAG: AI-2E family transporter [Acidobacteria bacterium]|nr:AI-2E family transporter [Acidobacteriota bacterium]
MPTKPRPRVEPITTAPPPDRAPASRLATALQGLATVALVLTLCHFGRLVIITILISILFAFILEPFVQLLQRIRVPRPASAFVAVCLTVLALYGATYVFYNRAVDFVQQVPKYSAKVGQIVMRFRRQAQDLQKATETILPATRDERRIMRVQPQTNWSEYLTQSASTLSAYVFVTLFIPFLVYFMLTWKDHVRQATVMLFRPDYQQTAYVTLGRISAMIRSFLVGNVIIGIFLALASTLAFGLIGLPYFYFIGATSAVLSLVPYMGVVLALVPPLVAGLGSIGGEGLAAIFITVIALHLFAFNVLYPKLLGKRLQLNPLTVTIAMLFWGWLWGAMGLILAVPITAAVKIIFDHIDVLRPYAAWLGEQESERIILSD